MAQLIRPRRWLPGVKPIGPVEIDWKHSFAEELLFYAGVGMQDLVSGAVATPVTSYGSTKSGIAGPADQGKKYGQGLESHSITDGGFEFAGTDIRRLHLQEFVTVLWAESFTTLSDAGTGLTIPWSDTAWVSPWFTVSLNRSTTTDQARFAFTQVSNIFRTMTTTAGGYIVADGVVRMIAAAKDDTDTVKFYRDGQFIESVTKSNFLKRIVTPANNFSIYIFSKNRSAADAGMVGKMYLGVYWKRTQSAEFLADFYSDPYAHLVPKIVRSYFIVELGDATGTAAQTLVEFTQAATGVMQPSGTVAHTLEPLAQTAVGTEKFIGATAQQVELLAQVAVGVEIFVGAGTQTLELFTQLAAGEEKFIGTAEQTLDLFTQVAAGLETFIGTSNQTLELLTQLASGVVEFVGTVTQTTEPFIQAAVGVELFIGTVGQTTESFTQLASGAQGAEGSAAQTLELFIQLVDGVMLPSGSVLQDLQLFTQVSIGVLSPDGTAAQTMPPFSQLAAGVFTSAAGAGQFVPFLRRRRR